MKLNPDDYTALDYIRAYKVAQIREDFQKYVQHVNPDFTWGWFNRLLAYKLTKFYEDYQAGKSPRLMIMAPPRSGKSQLASRHFPAWAFGRDARIGVIACSYAADLAETMSLDVRRGIQDQLHQEIFPWAVLDDRKESPNRSDLWQVKPLGSGRGPAGVYRAAGVGGPITGQGFNIGIIDDPVKDFREASSETIQKRHMEWYDSTFYTRRNPAKNGIMLIMTRWHKNDLGGQLLAKAEKGEGDQWDVIRFPMEATEDETYDIEPNRTIKLRKKGQILFPARMDAKFVADCKKSLPVVWSALYQQNPIQAGGGIIPIKEFRNYNTPPKAFRRVVVTCDTALTVKKHSDYSVFQVWAQSHENQMFLIHQIRGKWESPELLARAREVWRYVRTKDWGPGVYCGAIHIEEAAAGYGLIQQLKNGIGGESVPVIGLKTTKDKVTRVHNFGPTLMSGQVCIPTEAPWRKDFLDECEAFTADDSHDHDDMVDAMCYAGEILYGTDSGGAANYSGWANVKI